jgi:hypothetical protein
MKFFTKGPLRKQNYEGKCLPVLNKAPRDEDVLGSGGIVPRIL